MKRKVLYALLSALIAFGLWIYVVTVVSPESAPVKRLMQDAKDAGRTIDVSCGRRTRSVIVTDSEHVILSALQTETIANRLNGSDDQNDGGIQ